MRHLIYILLSIGLSNLASASEAVDKPAEPCHSAREFITTLEYLRSKKEFGIEENQAQTLAHKVSKGCTGAAQRFIRTVELLDKVEAGSKVAVGMGVKLANKTDQYAETFSGLFKRSYLKEYFDLDLTTSLKIASTLSLDYKGDVRQAMQDYFKIAQFCISDEVNLPPPSCATLAQEVVKNNELQKKPAADSFIRVYKFVRKTETLSPSVQEALKITRRVVKVSPDAADNFIDGYKYAVSDRGLKLTAKDSLGIAYQLVDRTLPDTTLTNDPTRLPASKK